MIKRKRTLSITAIFTFILLAAIPQTAQPADRIDKGRILTVGDDGEYPSLTEALHEAMDGDTVRLGAGTFDETVRIDRAIRLIGDNTDKIRTILRGKAGGAVLTVRSPGVIIENLKLSGENNATSDGLVIRAGGARLRNLVIQGFSGQGLVLSGVSGCEIRNCYFIRNRLGVVLRRAEGNRLFRNFFFSNQLPADAFLSSENEWNDESGRGNYWSGYDGRDSGDDIRPAGDGLGDTGLPWLGLDPNPLVFPTGLRLLPGCEECAAGGEPEEPVASDQAASSENTVDNGNGTFTFTQQVDEYSSAPQYTASPGFGDSICGSPSGAGFGWMHTFPSFNENNIQILSATLSVRAYDVDSEPSHGQSGEYDGILGDGSWLNPQYLQGTNGTWSVTNFDVDPSALLDGALNVYCDIDMNTQGSWCTTLDYSRISITYTFLDNDPPYTPTLAISPSGVPMTGDTLSVTVTGPSPADPDGDSVSYEYRWLVDVGTGSYIDDEFAGRGNHTGTSVPSGDTQNGDRWMVEVTPVDEHGARGTKNSVAFGQIGGTNSPPIADAGGDQTVAVGATCTLDGSGSMDSDGSITGYLWELYSGGSWSSIGSTQIITYTFSAAGAYTVRLTVTDDDGDSDDSLAYITVEQVAVNQPPVVSGIPDQTISEGQSFATISLDNYVSDPDNTDAEMNWSWSGNSELGVAVVGRVATITVPSSEWSGGETITFTAADPGGLSSGDAALFTVTAVNDPPVVSGIPDQTIDEGQSFATISLDNYVSDLDNADAEMNWSWSGNSELGVAVVGRVATITVPDENWNGSETITFTAVDPGGLSSGDAALFTVSAVNDAPTISGTPATSVDEDTEYVFTPAAEDIDAGDTLTFSIQNRPPWAAFDTATGALSGTPENDDVGAYSDIIITVTDSQGASASLEPFSIQVNNTNDAPTVENPLPDQDAVEDEAFSFTFAADTFQDVDDGDTLTYSAVLGDDSPLPAWLTFTPASRTFSGTPGNDDTENLTIKVSADDGNGGSAEDSFALDVEAVNDAPELTLPAAAQVEEDTELPLPGIVAADIDVGEGTLRATLTVEHGTLRLEKEGSVPEAGLNIEGTLAEINTALEGLIYRGDAHFNGSDTVRVTLDDLGGTGTGGALTDSGDVTIEVRPVNDAPVLTTPPAVSLMEDEEKPISGLSIEDVDAGEARLDVLIAVRQGRVFLNSSRRLDLASADMGENTLSLSGSLDNLNAALAGITYQGDADFNGRDEMSISVNDNGNSGSGGWKADEGRIKLIISAVNDPPAADAGETQHVGEGQPVTLDGSESRDPEGGDLIFRWEQISGPGVGLSDPSARRPGFTAPAVEAEGTLLEFELTVEDPDGLSDRDTVAVNILNGTRSLFFPRVISTEEQDTTIVLINSSGENEVEGRLIPYNRIGRLLPGTLPLNIPPATREEIPVGEFFSAAGRIAYCVFESDDPGISGLVRYVIGEQTVPGHEALVPTSRDSRLISRIVSDDEWKTEFVFINTSPIPAQPVLELDNGGRQILTIQSREQVRFDLRDLFDGVPQSEAHSARLTGAERIVGVQVIENQDRRRSIEVDDQPQPTLDFPFIPDFSSWWARFDFMNGAETREKIKFTYYNADGGILGQEKRIIPGGDRLSLDETDLTLPPETAWLRAFCRNGIAGEITFGTRDDNQMGGYSAAARHGRQGVIPALKGRGENRLILINSEKTAAIVRIQAWDDAGNLLAQNEIEIPGQARISGDAEEIFSGIPMDTMSHFTFDSNRLLLGYIHHVGGETGRVHIILAIPTDTE